MVAGISSMSFSEVRAGSVGWSDRLTYRIVFACFFLSGFSSLLYQVVWTRLAFAQFGVITPVLSLIISVFMLGLGLGAVYGASWVTSLGRWFGISPLQLYAGAEALTAVGAFAVPASFVLGGSLLLRAGTAGSAGFLALSAVFIVLALLPWCVMMGSTIPLMMAFVRRSTAGGGGGFSFLYAANVLGAAAGAIVSAVVLIELLGLHATGEVGAAGNILAALLALALSQAAPDRAQARAAPHRVEAGAAPRQPAWPAVVLFTTGFASMGLEVCWTRDFTFTLATTIYAFAAILAVYLLATFAGSLAYRHLLARDLVPPAERVLGWLFPLALLPVLLSDPRLGYSGVVVLLSIVPFCGLLGFVTPGLVDRFAGDDPRRAGAYYALNIAGGILGPLVAGYLLLPVLGIRWAMIVLALPLPAVMVLATGWRMRGQAIALLAVLVTLPIAVARSHAWDEGVLYPTPHQVRRDYAASVVAWGAGRSAQLAVNGIRITSLTNETKIMAHLPMVLEGDPRSALDICFGMGTTFRSLTSWGVSVVAVDLSPSVIDSFRFFYPDAPAILANPHNRTVVDDGRRYLLRTHRTFDVITVDPPPPVAAAGSSLLYSVQFYRIVRRRLTPHGILAQWLPDAGPRVRESVALALRQVFPHVLVFRAARGTGVHFMASMTPIRVPDVATFIARMPPKARRDLMEWDGNQSLRSVVHMILARQEPLAAVLPPLGSGIPALSDNRPFNEYFLLRQIGLAP